MQTLTAIQVLHALDGPESELRQAMAILSATDRDPLELSLGAGDRALVATVVAVTGAQIESTGVCQECGEVNEIAVGSSQLEEHEPRSRWLGPGLGVREPTYGDLVDLPKDGHEAMSLLCERCSIGPVPFERALEAINAIDSSLAGPINIACVNCEAQLVVDADIEQLAMQRLRGVAARAEREVHLLASSYAWDLATIEALPDARRERLARMVEMTWP